MAEEKAFVCKGREYRIADAMPLTLGDLRKLEKAGVSQKVFQQMDSDPESFSYETLFQFIAYMLKKIDPNLTDEDIETIEMTPAHIEELKASQGEEPPDPNS